MQGGTIIKSGANYDGQAGTVSANLQGAVGLDKTTAGTLTLSGANSYTGATTISDGTLALATSPDRLPTTGDIIVNGGILDLGGTTVGQSTSGAVVINGGTIQNGTLTKTGAINFDGRSGTVSAILAGAVGITKTTAGTLILSGASTMTGKSIISEGIVQVGNGGAFGADPAAVVADQITMAAGTTLRVASGTQDHRRKPRDHHSWQHHHRRRFRCTKDWAYHR